MVASPMVIDSSTNYSWEQTTLEEEGFRPLRLPASTFLRMNLPKHSTRIMNRIGDMGSPCLRPLEKLKKLDGEPLTITTKEEVSMSWEQSWITLSPKPNAFMILRRNYQFTLSKALAMSNFKKNPWLFATFKEWMFSWMEMIESKIYLPRTKPFCWTDIILGRISNNLEVRTLDKIF